MDGIQVHKRDAAPATFSEYCHSLAMNPAAVKTTSHYLGPAPSLLDGALDRRAHGHRFVDPGAQASAGLHGQG